MTKKKTNKGAILMIALLAFMVICVPLMIPKSAKADTVTVHKFDTDKFANDFKWTTYSYELVDSHTNVFIGDGGFKDRTAMDNWASYFGIGYKYVFADNSGLQRIVINDSTDKCITIDTNVYPYAFDIVEVQMLGPDYTFYSMVAYKTADGCVIDFNELQKESAYVVAINFFKVKTVNDGTKSWNVNLSVTSDLSDTVLYSETFVPKGSYNIMYSAIMDTGANNLGKTLGAYYGTIDSLKQSDTQSYVLTSAGFSSTADYETALAGYNTNYSRYNIAYDTLTANGTNYKGTNLDKYYGYDEEVEITSSSSSGSSNSSSSSSSSSEDPITSEDPVTSEDPITSETPDPEDPPITEDPPQTDIEDPKDVLHVNILDYEKNTVAQISIYSQDYNTVSVEEFESALNELLEEDSNKAELVAGLLNSQRWEYLVDVDGSIRKQEFVFGETQIVETINIYPAECVITVLDEEGKKLTSFEIPYNTVLTLDMLNEKIGGSITDIWQLVVRNHTVNYTFGQPVTLDSTLKPLMHVIEIIDNSVLTEDEITGEMVGQTLVKEFIGNGTVITKELIDELMPEDIVQYVVDTIDYLVLSTPDYKYITFGDVIDNKNQVSVCVYINPVYVDTGDNPPEDGTLPDDENKIPGEEDSSDNIPGGDDEGGVGLGNGDGHEFDWKKPIKFPCKECGISFWTYLWEAFKWYVISFVIAVVIVIAIFITVAIVRRK